MEKIFITGGSGFIGTNLVQYYLDRDVKVLNYDIKSPRNKWHAKYWHHADILDREALLKAVQEFNPDYIFHLAARTDLDGKCIEDYAANTQGVSNLVEAAKRTRNLKRVIFASSRLVCRIGYEPKDDSDYCPTTPYGESKVLGENIVRSAAHKIPCPWLIVRPTSIWGPWFDVPYKTFFLTVAKGHYVHPGSATVLKSFGFIGNTMYELQRLLDASADSVLGKTLYLADYPPIDVAVMANAIQKELDVVRVRTVNVGLLRLAALTGDMLKMFGWRNPPLTSFRLNNLLTPMVHDLKPLREIVGELPYSMEYGVKITVKWLKSSGNV